MYSTVKEKGVETIRLQFTDIQGIVKNVAVPVTRLGKALKCGIAFDGSSIEGFARIQESDMILRPDISTFSLLPWKAKDGSNEAKFICDVYTPGGKPFEGDPRYVLRGIVRSLTEMGFTIEASHHEVGKGQHEIDFVYDDALKNADKVVTFKYVTKTIATQMGLRATFMPKPPIYGAAGTGMHANVSLFRGSENAFNDPDAPTGISDLAINFIGGLLEHAPAITAISNPLINSYKRLVSGFEPPVYISWSGPNRSSLIRIPAGRGLSTRLEFRSPDTACNPYLAFAAILAAGLDGVKRDINPGKPTDANVYDLTPKEREGLGIKMLPSNLHDALCALDADMVIKDALGEHVFSNFMRLGKLEWEAYNTYVHPWEIERYINLF